MVKNNVINKTIEPDKKYFKHIKNCLTMFANGENISNIQKYIKDKKVKMKNDQNKLLSIKALRRILSKSMFYAGKYNWKENKNIKGKHMAMITWEEHLIIQNRLTSQRSAQLISNHKRISPFWLNFNYLPFTGFLHCAGCDSRIRSAFSTGHMHKKYPYYYCPNTQCSLKQRYINKNILEALVEKNLESHLPNSDQFKIFRVFILNQLEEESLFIYKTRKVLNNHIQTYEESNGMSVSKSAFSPELLYNINNLVSKSELLDKLINMESVLKSLVHIYSTADSKLKQKVLTIIYPKGVLLSQNKVFIVEQNPLISLIFKVSELKMQANFNNDQKFVCSLVYKQINEVLKIQNN